jgi:D-alanyl-D-alanine carboxypeptidase
MNQVLIKIHEELGIQTQHLRANKLTVQEQPSLEKLVVVDIDFDGRPFILISAAANAWRKMQSQAEEEQVLLKPYSGFRSYMYQKNLIEKHLKNGRKLEDILTDIAIPGFSEHHTGRAVDIYQNGNAVLEDSFEQTESFLWLTKNAHQYGFCMSYPRDNPWGIVYEPWHWFYTES